MGKFIEAVAKATGRKQVVPEAWLDHPVLGEDFRQTPRNTARQAATSKRAAKKAAAAKKATAKPTAPAAGTNQAPVTGDKE